MVVLRLDNAARERDGERALRSARRRPRSRRVSRVLASLLIAVGTLVIADAVVTLVWQEPISALYAKLRQDHLKSALRSAERAPLPAAERKALASVADESARLAVLARELQRRTGEGSAVGRIDIPRIGADFVVVNGTDTAALESGPGVYPQTGFPGSGGTTAIAGHRTTFLAPFRHIDALARGDLIHLNMPYARFTYAVLAERVVAPTDVRAAEANVGYSRLVLSACTPLFSAAKRLLVYAKLTRTVPVGAALRLPAGVHAQPIEVAPHATAAVPRRLPAVLIPLDPGVLSPIIAY